MTDSPTEKLSAEHPDASGISRRKFLVLGGAAVAATMVPPFVPEQLSGAVAIEAPAPTAAAVEAAPSLVKLALQINGLARELELDTRVTLLDALREHLHLTGSKKGCDHGQCGACTVLVNGQRINACLTLAVMHGGDEITTIEGLGTPENLHPMQKAFIQCDGFQCGYCTPGQICSAMAVLKEIKAGVPSHVTADLTAPTEFNALELRERMSGNLCRCGAYSNIVEAVTEVAGQHAHA